MQLKRVHPLVRRSQAQLKEGAISRRDFLRQATLLGVSVTTAHFLAGCMPSETQDTGRHIAQEGDSTEMDAIRSGGRIRVGLHLEHLDHPARANLFSDNIVFSHVCETLTEVGPDNLVRPLLLDRWEASDDLTAWTFYLRKDVTFNNGQPLTAEDVLGTMAHWLSPDFGSSMLDILENVARIEPLTAGDDYAFRIILKEGLIGLPEHLAAQPAVILPANFQGHFEDAPIGTGPFLLESYEAGEQATLRARDDYWRTSQKGEQLPYLDEIVIESLLQADAIDAMWEGRLDVIRHPATQNWRMFEDSAEFNIHRTHRSNTMVLRMRTDMEPWSDNRVRLALKLCQDRQRILDEAYFGAGQLGHDAHIAPSDPAYSPFDIPAYDPERARELLEAFSAETNTPLPLEVTLTTKNDGGEKEYARILKESAEPAGFAITLDIRDPGGFWDEWDEVPLGITAWAHRFLATETLGLAYDIGEDRQLVPWNETRWEDEEFISILYHAKRTLDVAERRKQMAELERIFAERGPIGIACFEDALFIAHQSLQGIAPTPRGYFRFRDVWLSN